MRCIVVQLGARGHYAIPRMLETKGCLEALYTDSCANLGAGRLLDLTVPEGLRGGAVRKLLQRRISGVPASRIRSTDRLLAQRHSAPRKGDVFTRIDRIGTRFSRRMIQWGIGRATHVYSSFGEGLEFCRFAKERGLRICIDVFITPVAHRIVAEERRHFPEWEGGPAKLDERLEPRIREIADLADVLICPSQNVVDGLAVFAEESINKAHLVPYGCGANFHGRYNAPIPGRILFGGTAELRKGIHYFAAAARRLGSVGYDFRVAGNVTEKIRNLPECKSLTFLGRVSREEMVEEILCADLLVLPTLAEGSAYITGEAIVAGLPQVTTRSAGSLVVDRESGLIVPERDVEALIESIGRVVHDRALRRQFAEGTRSAAGQLSEEAWSERLIAALAG